MDVRIVQDGKNPVVGSIDAIQIPFGSADSSIARAHNGQRATLGKRGCLQAKAEAPKAAAPAALLTFLVGAMLSAPLTQFFEDKSFALGLLLLMALTLKTLDPNSDTTPLDARTPADA